MFKRGACGCLLILLALTVSACKSSSEPASDDNGLVVDPIEAQRMGFAIGWISPLDIGSDQSFEHLRVLDDVVLATESPSNIATCYALRDGAIRWRRVVGERADRLFPPRRSEDKLLFNTDGQIFTFDVTSGKLMSIGRLESAVRTEPAMVGTYAIYGSVTGLVFAHDTVTGGTRWAYRVARQILTPPVTVGTGVLVADAAGGYAMFTGRSGQLLWRSRTFGPVLAEPAVSRTAVYLPSTDHSLYAVNRSTGRDRWIYRATRPLTQPPVVAGDLVLLPLPGEALVALDQATGDELWRLGAGTTGLAEVEDGVLVAETEALKVVDADSGKTVRELRLPPYRRILTTGDGQLIIATRDGRLVMLRPIR